MAGKKTGRRGNGEGTIGQRSDGRWYAQITVPETGKRKTVYASSREDARDQLTRLRNDLLRGLSILPERQTVERYLATWLAERKTVIGPATWVRDECSVRLYLVPAFGRITLAKLTAPRIQATYAEWLTKGPQGYPVARSTIERIHATLSAALSDAEDRDYIPRNVAHKVHLPKAERRRDVVSGAWTAEQAGQFIEACRGHEYGTLMTLAVTTGLRPQELLALHWRDVDLDCGTISVRAKMEVQIAGGFNEVSGAKSRAGWRTFRVSNVAWDALRAQRADVARLKLAAQVWSEQDLVFPNAVGEHRTHHNYGYWFHKLRRAAGLPHIRPYDMRHTAATMALQAGVPVHDVQMMLGHSKASMTMDIYGHASPGAERAAQGIDAALTRSRKSGTL